MRTKLNRAIVAVLAVACFGAFGCASNGGSSSGQTSGAGTSGTTSSTGAMSDTSHMAMPSSAPTDTAGKPH